MDPIYLDHNATTPVDPDVADVYAQQLRESFGNASSVHAFGRDAKVVLENARESIAGFVNCQPSEMYFTSGGTESDNISIIGAARQLKPKRNHIIVAATEHHAVIEPAEYLHEREGFDLDIVPVDEQGYVSPDALRDLVSDKTAIVSTMQANNETGVVQDIKTLAAIAHEKGALFHTDAVQSVGKIAVDVRDLDVDLLTLTAHKIYGPKGIGGLYIRQGIKLTPLFFGGSHEKKRRPGTENVAGAAAFARTLEIAGERMEQDHSRITRLADYFIDEVEQRIPDVRLNSPRDNRIPQTVNYSFGHTEGEALILSLDLEGISASSGSACTSGATEPSHVLSAMNVPRQYALGAVRFSLGRSTTREQIDHVLGVLPGIVERLRSMSPAMNRPGKPS
jgi:cysteine desulfurase